LKVIIYWFRNDLRLLDNPALTQACKEADFLLPIYVHDPANESQTTWHFNRVAHHRKNFLRESLNDLKVNLQKLGSDLFEFHGDVESVFQELKKIIVFDKIICEKIVAPEESDQLNSLIDAGYAVHPIWQSGMIATDDLPFTLNQTPDIFTQCRLSIEKHKIKYTNPIDAPVVLPSLPVASSSLQQADDFIKVNSNSVFQGGETSALAHIEQYFQRRLPDTYKQTRNQLIGLDYSSKFSPWLAWGCCSARTIANKLESYEAKHGANDGTYWLWFELLWRDYFRFIHFKYGKKLYSPKGLSEKPLPRFKADVFKSWSEGETGEPLIDAAMRELKTTGYLSNRLRQVVASYLIYDLEGDWQSGAAWFESQLIDYDVYSNQGNWLYIAGRGTDPRGGRAFNVKKQTQDHDPQGTYRRMWLQ
jgi:deoxyribodipyrimidine photo-lyase